LLVIKDSLTDKIKEFAESAGLAQEITHFLGKECEKCKLINLSILVIKHHL